MPEHDISKHTKAIYSTLKEPNKNWKHKLSEVLIEILIIVFAITLSLLLERWRENAHERTIEKKFLTGLRQDLQADIRQLSADSASYENLLKGWMYMRGKGINKQALDADSLKQYGETLINGVEFIPNDSRFEALKSSGNLDVIEDDSLKSLVLDLYQNKLRLLQMSNSYFSNFKTGNLFPFLFKNLRTDKEGKNNLSYIVQMPEMQNYLMIGNVSYEIIGRYHNVISQSRRIIEMINKQYAE